MFDRQHPCCSCRHPSTPPDPLLLSSFPPTIPPGAALCSPLGLPRRSSAHPLNPLEPCPFMPKNSFLILVSPPLPPREFQFRDPTAPRERLLCSERSCFTHHVLVWFFLRVRLSESERERRLTCPLPPAPPTPFCDVRCSFHRWRSWPHLGASRPPLTLVINKIYASRGVDQLLRHPARAL